MSKINKDEIFDYLDSVRESGSINMFGAGPLLQEEFKIDRYEARDVLIEWMESYPRRG